MPEILTESFCERCGTRYTFESNAPRGKGIGRFRTLSKGLKNFVLSDDSSLDEALAAARSDVEREAVSQQLDAFHKTFNFCMTCRQYTCSNCWNETEGRCLTCAPGVGRELAPSAFPQLELNGNGAHAAHAEPGTIEGMAWPTVDLRTPEPPAAGEDVWPEDDAAATSDLAARLAALGVAPADEESTDATVAQAAVEEEEEAEPAPDVAARLAALGIAPAADEPVIEEEVLEAVVDEPVEVAADEPEMDWAAAEVQPQLEVAEPEIHLADSEPYFAPDPEPIAEPAVAATGQPEGELALEASGDVEAEPDLDTPALAQLEVPGEAFELEAEPLTAEQGSDAVADVALEEEPLAAAPADPAAVAAAQTVALLGRFRPGQSIDDALAAFEATTSPEERPAIAAEPEPVVAEPEPVPAAVAVEPEPVVAAAEPVVAPEPGPVVAGIEPEPVVAAAEPVVAPAPEPIVAEPVAAVEPEPVAAVEPELVIADPEPIAAPQPEPVVAAVEPEPVVADPEPVAVSQPEPAAAEPQPVVVAEPEPQPVAAAPEPPPAPAAPSPAPEPQAPVAPRQDRVEVPAWRIVAPDAPATADGHPAPAEPAMPVAASAEPQWPATPEWPTTPSRESDALAFLTAKRTRSADDLWTASNREVLSAAPAAEATPAVQACLSCGLSLSATARFCRRCGTRQG